MDHAKARKSGDYVSRRERREQAFAAKPLSFESLRENEQTACGARSIFALSAFSARNRIHFFSAPPRLHVKSTKCA
jgi:hypothetical protein